MRSITKVMAPLWQYVAGLWSHTVRTLHSARSNVSSLILTPYLELMLGDDPYWSFDINGPKDFTMTAVLTWSFIQPTRGLQQQYRNANLLIMLQITTGIHDWA